MIQRTCLNCGKSFSVFPYIVRRGGGRFCSIGCGTSYRNKIDNPAWRPDVRLKISINHANVSGEENPMFGRRGKDCPGYIDGRRMGENGQKLEADTSRILGLFYKGNVCEICDREENGRKIHVHHIDRNKKNNNLSNLKIVCSWCHNNIIHKRKRDKLGRYASEEVMQNVGSSLHSFG